MLFNSYGFLLLFLPTALLLHWVSARYFSGGRLIVLIALSFIFYGYWDWRFVPLLALSIVVNWFIAGIFVRVGAAWLIVIAITLNLSVLAFFKYATFVSSLIYVQLPTADIFGMGSALPLGISFFTFHHIMYLTDLRAGLAPRYNLTKYALYIAFFPQVLAGPLVRWNEIMHQFDERTNERSNASELFARGFVLLIIGLGKKVFIGDMLADPANHIFYAVTRVQVVSFLDAWQAVLAFTFQIYFDFSGYTDMAIGMAMMFGIVLPQNFDAPYRAASLQNFWRRWHMTLSRFLRDYLYIPLGGNRFGLNRQIAAIIVTMLLGGLWHGAGITFIVWGVLHGLGLSACALWRRTGFHVSPAFGFLATFGFVVVTWVIFRSPTIRTALDFYRGMFLPIAIEHRFGDMFNWPIIVFAAALAFFGPTSWKFALEFRPSLIKTVPLAAIIALSLIALANGQNYKFIYFQF